MKADERKLFLALWDYLGGKPWREGEMPANTPRAFLRAHPWNVPEKRALYLLRKWAGQGWYDYGVSLDLGWFTPEAEPVIEGLRAQEGSRG